MRTALLDLDGTLLDLVGHLFRALGADKSFADLRGNYDMGQVLGLRADLYSRMGPDFWESLPWLPDGRRLLEAVTDRFGARTVLCTSPTRESSSASAKLRWIARELPDWWRDRRYVLTSEKWLLARRDAVLIDDCDEQVNRFRAAGGEAVLVPRPWNSLWQFAGDVPAWLGRQLDERTQ